MVGFCTAYASAATPTWLLRAKAGVLSAMLASQLVLEPIQVVMDSPLLQALDPLNKVEWVETLPEYLERSTIKVVENTVIIDGVEYSDVWLGPDAANALRLQGLDFATAYNIANNQADITYANGYGYAGSNQDVPLYLLPGNNVKSPLYRVNYGTTTIGGVGVTISDNSSTSTTNKITIALNNPYGTSSSKNVQDYGYAYTGTYGAELNSAYGSSIATLRAGFLSTPTTINTTSTKYNSASSIPVTQSPFSFDYTSGVIDEPLDPEDGLLIRVPTSYTDPQTGTVIYDIHDFTINYPDISQPGGHEIEIDPNLNPEFQTDIDLGNGLGDLLLTIFGLDLLNKILEFAPEPSTPEPGPEPGVIDPLPDPDPAPDDPSAGTTIANTDWTKLDELLRWIQSTIDSIRHLTESLQTMLDSLFDRLQHILEEIQTLPDKILEEIELGPSKLFDKALDILKTLFLPLLLPIRAMMNLWHYVVEWIQSVSSPFTWIFGIMSSTSYNMVLPIYAVLAGGICISIYKALGR